jgi:hypothetical protein
MHSSPSTESYSIIKGFPEKWMWELVGNSHAFIQKKYTSAVREKMLVWARRAMIINEDVE